MRTRLPTACAAGVAVAETIESDNILQNVVARGDQLRRLALALQTKNPGLISDVRGWGLINGVELVDDCGVTAADMTKALMAAGVLVVPAGPRVVRFVPPLIVSEEEVDMAMTKFAQALQTLSSSKVGASK